MTPVNFMSSLFVIAYLLLVVLLHSIPVWPIFDVA